MGRIGAHGMRIGVSEEEYRADARPEDVAFLPIHKICWYFISGLDCVLDGVRAQATSLTELSLRLAAPNACVLSWSRLLPLQHAIRRELLEFPRQRSE
jgi:hypothetical protein